MNTTQAAANLVGTTLTIGRRTFTVEAQTDTVYGVNYVLAGVRGAKYGTMRNKHNPGMMFIINLRGFGPAAGYEGVWLTDRNGTLERVS